MERGDSELRVRLRYASRRQHTRPARSRSDETTTGSSGIANTDGATATYGCDVGYTGADTLSCSVGGWSAENLVCDVNPCSGAAPTVNHSTQMLSGLTVTYTCTAGYQNTAGGTTATSTCNNANDTWGAVMPANACSVCASGYVLVAGNCVMNPCNSDPCDIGGAGVSCTGTSGTAVCDCVTGRTDGGSNCNACDNANGYYTNGAGGCVNPCNSNPCGVGATSCTALSATTYACMCMSNWDPATDCTACLSGYILVGGNCVPTPSCQDQIMNQDEAGIDCGGVCPTGCPNGTACDADSDCAGVCDLRGSNVCESANACGNGKDDAAESCDDGNVMAGDGCNATCATEGAYVCYGGAALYSCCDSAGSETPDGQGGCCTYNSSACPTGAVCVNAADCTSASCTGGFCD
ncbi:MAG: hypothetical protein R3A47_09870 [Polyangiales bacterium]